MPVLDLTLYTGAARQYLNTRATHTCLPNEIRMYIIVTITVTDNV
jgi:hypothetical protein